jgi:hypothetical protein
MRCIAVPDQFTAFEDFSGANAIVEEDAGYGSSDLFGVLCPHLVDA